jgi:hypothetical protein
MGRAHDTREPLPTFVVDRSVPGMTTELLLEAQKLLHEAARRVSAMGETVRYLRCTFIPQDHRCLCLFEAADLESVRRVNDIAQVPFRLIGPAIEFSAPGTTSPGDPPDAHGRSQT